ncbi:MAG: nitroreductase [Verrucomicrobiota bacterium]
MSEAYRIVESVIRQRATEKVLCGLEDREPVAAEVEAIHQPLVQAALESAGWAPFHYSRAVDSIAEPWRAHVLWNQQTRQLSRYLSEVLQIQTKEPQLAAACSALVLITWLPEIHATEPEDPKVTIRNEEHLAAASAMVQNLLLLLTAHSMGNYWSSGGCLRNAEVFQYLQIPQEERLLAAVFIEYPELPDSSSDAIMRKPGALREQRSNQWIRILDLSHPLAENKA